MSDVLKGNSPRPDRRRDRSRGAILAAFRDLLFERGFAAIASAEIADRANVGRSTLYEHFGGKEGILRASLAGGPFEGLAGIVDGSRDLAATVRLVQHFRENQRLAVRLSDGATRPIVIRALADVLEGALPLAPLLLPRRLAALQIAEAQFGLIEHWLTGGLPCRGEILAEALIATTGALVAALRQP